MIAKTPAPPPAKTPEEVMVYLRVIYSKLEEIIKVLNILAP